MTADPATCATDDDGGFVITRDARALLAGLAEPVALLSLDGVIRWHNPPFRNLLGRTVEGQALTDLDGDGREGLARFLERAAGTGAPLLGTVLLASREGARHRIYACRVQLENQPALFVQIDAREEKRFARLTRELAALNREVAERRHAQAVLAETVRERELLLRELQHRVKNNMNMLASLLRRAERESRNAAAKSAFADVLAKVSAIGAVQQLLYVAKDPTTIDALGLVEAVTHGVVMLAPYEIDCAVDGEPRRLQVNAATSVALILNELLTNAVKHGRPQAGTPAIGVALRSEAECLVLEVRDNGPGMTEGAAQETASGLGLVRGLLRQLEGTLAIDGEGGTRCTVAIPATSLGAGVR